MRDFRFVGLALRRPLAWISLVVLLAMIAFHFGLVDLGQWTNDEFAIIGSYREEPLTAFYDRLINWSPRPISEALIWIYACLVNLTHKPCIGIFLGLLWLGLLATPLIAYRQLRITAFGKLQRPSLYFSLFASALIAFFLLEHSPGELFYWPVGAAAYVTTLSAITLCFFQVACSRTEHHGGRIVTSLSLVFTAGSSETGALFALVFGCFSLVGMSADQLRRSVHPRKIFWYLIPALFGTGVFFLLVNTRTRAQEALFPTAEYHNVYFSLQTAVGQALKECLVTGQRLSTRSMLFGFTLKACFFLAVRY